MRLGSLVKHNPVGSPIEVILQKIASDEEPHPDFALGVVIATKMGMSKVHSPYLKGEFWYDNKELKLA